MNVETIWSRLTRAVIVLLVVAAVLLVNVSYLPLVRENERLRQEELRLADQIRKQDDILRQKQAAIEALRNDPGTIERLAREKLGLAKPGETVIHFEAATNPLPESAPPPR